MVRLQAGVLAAWFLGAGVAAAQDQTIVVDRPLDVCATSTSIDTAALTQAQARAVIQAAMPGVKIDPEAYYIVHATEFVPNRPIVAEEHWFVYHEGWEQKSRLWWFRDSRQMARFKEARIMGAEKVALVYLYVNVPGYVTHASREKIADHFRRKRLAEFPPAPAAEAEAQREELKSLATRLKDSLNAAEESRAEASAREDLPVNPDVRLVAQLDAERYLKALGTGDRTVTNELALVDQDTGAALVGLSPTFATTAAFGPLQSLFYKVTVTSKTPAPIANLKDAARLAFSAHADVQTRIPVEVRTTSLCAGAEMAIKHVPSDVLVASYTRDEKKADVERSKQTFDNEGRYWWDVSFALPLDLRRDVTIDVDDGQVAAKKIDKGDLFAVVNLGLPRDTKKRQWQLIPTVLYGVSVTSKPLHHHLVGLAIGLNYVQIFGGYRFDRLIEVSAGSENGVPVGEETAPAGKQWDRTWVWGINLPVSTVVKAMKGNAK